MDSQSIDKVCISLVSNSLSKDLADVPNFCYLGAKPKSAKSNVQTVKIRAKGGE